MARHLALDWDYQQLRIVAATVRTGELRLEQAAVWDEEQSPNCADARALGQRLRERLKSACIAPAPVLACVGRDRVILREVRYPAVAAAEEPAIVRFQVLKELTDAASDVIIDYTPLGEAAPGEERRALVLTVRRELLSAYQTLCQAAGLKLLALTPRPFGTMACLRDSVKKWESTGALAEVHTNGSPQAAVALLTAADNWSEFCLMRGDTLLLARSLPVGPTLPAEVRRNLAMYTAQSPRHTVSGLYLAGNGETAGLQESLQQALGIPVRSVDPFLGAEDTVLPRQNRGAFAGAVGLLRAQTNGQRLPINFVSPKQPEVARDPNKRRLAVAAGVVAALLIGVVSYCYAQLAALDRQVDNLTAKRLTLETQMPQVDEENNRYKQLSEWCHGNISWLDELYDLTAMWPDLQKMRLLEFRGELKSRLPGKEAAKEKPAEMTLTFATLDDYHVVDELLDRMRGDLGHYVPGTRERKHDSLKDPQFNSHFQAPIALDKQPADKFKLSVLKTANTKPGRIQTVAATRSQSFVGNSGGAPVNRKRVADPQPVSRVKLIAPAVIDEKPKPGVNRAVPVKAPQLQPPPPNGPNPDANNFAEQYQLLMDAAQNAEQEKARALIEQARQAAPRVRTRESAATPPAVAAPPKGKTP